MDTVRFMYENLPSVITVTIPDGRKIGYELHIISNFSRGLLMSYHWHSAWTNFDVDDFVANMTDDEYEIMDPFIHQFGEMANFAFIWSCEYIRSDSNMRAAVMACHAWLTKHRDKIDGEVSISESEIFNTLTSE